MKIKNQRNPLWWAIGIVAILAIIVLTKVNRKNIDVTTSYVLVSTVDYKCDKGKQINASFYNGPTISVSQGEMPKPNGKVNLILSDGRNLELPQTISGSGIRYANTDESIIFWSKGDTSFLLENNVETFSSCKQ